MITFSPSRFSGTVTFYPPGTAVTVELHGDPVIGGEPSAPSAPPAGSITFAPTDPGGAIPWGGGGAYIEPASAERGLRVELHHTPEGSRPWWVNTAADPGCGVDWLVVWDGRLLRVTAAAAHTDGWALWQTPCSEVV